MSVYHASAPSPFKRLLPYARDHDRLQLALLYIDYEAAKLKSMDWDLDWLKRKQIEEEGFVMQHAQKLAEVEALYERGGTEWSLLEQLNDRVQRMKEDLGSTKERFNQMSTARDQAEKHVSYRPQLLELIQELYSSAFDGETPEFPHEDSLEALVRDARADLRKHSSACFSAVGLSLLGIGGQFLIVSSTLGELDQLVRSPYNRRAMPNLERAARAALLENHCRNFLESYHSLVDEVDEHLKEESPLPLSTLDRIENQEEFLRAMRLTMVLPVQTREAFSILSNINNQFRAFGLSIRTSRRINDERRDQAVKNFNAAHAMLDLRLQQLSETRRQILDHVVDPNHYSASTLELHLERSETISMDEYAKNVVQARINRARRANHLPALAPERCNPPGYSQVEDLREAQNRRESIITIGSSEAGNSTSPQITPEYERYLALRCDADSAVYGVLDNLVARARKDLLPVINSREALD
ncbi:hypothetical protein FRC12_012325 [Ceratobasidium sp. 428]|nr:hypothetical protein FRC12_012325 [Ceratobasidium sp. 428]